MRITSDSGRCALACDGVTFSPRRPSNGGPNEEVDIMKRIATLAVLAALALVLSV